MLDSTTVSATSVRSPDPIVAAFDRMVARDPASPIVVGPGHRTSRAELDALARAAAGMLDDAVPVRGRVGLLASNGASFLAALLACLRRARPVVLFDPGATPHEIDRVARALELSALLRAPSDAPTGARDFEVRSLGPGATSALHGSVVKLTSGTSGEPRGVLTSSDALLADGDTLRRAMQLDERDPVIAMIPFSHAYALGCLVIPALTAGVPLLLPSRGSPFEPLRIAAAAGGTVLPTVPAWIAALARLKEAPPWPATLRTVISAGAPLLPGPASAFRERFGPAVHVLYGASECGGITYDHEGGAGERGTVGEPLDGVHVELIGASAPEDEGRIAVRSPALASAYLPAGSGDLESGRFLSQDLAALQGRELRLVGRLDRVVNLKGLKIHPHEIERVIAEMELVEDVVIDTVSEAGRDEPVLRAVVAAPDGALTADDVIAWCRRRLSDHKVPRRVRILAAVPRNARAKPDRALLEELDRA
jgi:long-chain acyl-CoA synthetase